MGRIRKEYYCALQLAIDIVGGKWKLRIIWYLLESPKRFSDFMRRIPDISQKTLTQQLRELEDAKIIVRKVYAEVPPRVEYSLTDYGLRLQEILSPLRDWARAYASEEDILLLNTIQENQEEGKDSCSCSPTYSDPV